MRRRTLVAGILAAAASPAWAVPPRRKRPRVVVAASPGERDSWSVRFAEAGLKENSEFELVLPAIGSNRAATAAELARHLVESEPDVILVPGGELPLALQKATGTIPVVFYSFGVDPVKLGLVESLRRPGRNITGSTNHAIDAIGKSWEALLEIRPRARSIGCIVARSDLALSWMRQQRESQVQAANRLRLRRSEIHVDVDGPFSRVEESVLADGAEMIDVTGGYRWPWTDDLMRLLERRSIPAVWEAPPLVRRGGLLCLIGSIDEGIRAAVQIVVRIVKGESPATIPVYQSSRVILAVNLRTARAMGITLPQSLLLRASLVVE